MYIYIYILLLLLLLLNSQGNSIFPRAWYVRCPFIPNLDRYTIAHTIWWVFLFSTKMNPWYLRFPYHETMQ